MHTIKALLHAAEVVNTAKAAEAFGVHFAKPNINLAQLRDWKKSVIDKLAQGIAGMCKAEKVEVLIGKATFQDSQTLRVESGEEITRLKFKHAIVATGSRITRLNKLFKNPEHAQKPAISGFF